VATTRGNRLVSPRRSRPCHRPLKAETRVSRPVREEAQWAAIAPERFDAKSRLSVDVDAAIRTAPAPLFTIGVPWSNQLFYVKRPIQVLTLPDSTLAAPAWVLAPRSDLGQLEELRPDLVVREVPIPSASPGLALARIEWRPVAPPRP
jgi:hypothetical protein